MKKNRIGIAYFGMLCKRSLQLIKKSLGIVVLAIAGMVAIATILSHIFLQAQVMPVLQVAVCIPESETMSKLAVKYISNMDSVRSICRFQYLSEENALSDLQEGEVQAVIILPENFYEEVDCGINPPVTIYVENSEDERLGYFVDLVRSGVTYLQIAEAGVYASLDASRYFAFSVDYQELGNTLASFYEKQIIQRNHVFQSEFISPFGNYSLKEYYFAAGFLLCILCFSMQFRPLYDQRSRVVEEQLKIYGLNGKKAIFWKALVLFCFLSLFMLVSYLGSVLVCNQKELITMPFSRTAVWGMVFVAFCMTCFLQGIFSLAKNVKSGWMVVVVLFFLTICSGVFLPVSYLPETLGRIGNYLPMWGWFQMLLGALFQIHASQGMISMIIWALFGMIMSNLGAIKKCEK